MMDGVVSYHTSSSVSSPWTLTPPVALALPLTNILPPHPLEGILLAAPHPLESVLLAGAITVAVVIRVGATSTRHPPIRPPWRHPGSPPSMLLILLLLLLLHRAEAIMLPATRNRSCCWWVSCVKQYLVDRGDWGKGYLGDNGPLDARQDGRHEITGDSWVCTRSRGGGGSDGGG